MPLIALSEINVSLILLGVIIITIGVPLFSSSHFVNYVILCSYRELLALGLTAATPVAGFGVIVNLWMAVTSGGRLAPIWAHALSFPLLLLTIVSWVGTVYCWQRARFFGAMERKWQKRLKGK